ncbi:hypothetical protein QBC42DRAFT_264638 [Cladorrhinum samala]|uniref:Uncharacterized protein n=1 Tax=Cladorrhinum samala TaxID=585594 RepID=A0AAV9HW60_9PEZI|nr:hypothetical protein QBC42DRAFT_264638 [Cladorrhinum samala]
MHTASGTIICRGGSHVAAIFILDEIQYAFNANISPALPPFTAHSATVTFDDVASLTSSRSFSGHIGTDTFELNVDNGVQIKAQLNDPGVSSDSTFDGSGAWMQV